MNFRSPQVRDSLNNVAPRQRLLKRRASLRRHFGAAEPERLQMLVINDVVPRRAGVPLDGDVTAPERPPVHFSLSMIALSFFESEWLVLTPIMAKGLSLSLFTSDRSWGQLARQLGQYSCQKYSSTTLPR